ncbi:hypothetical protein TH63_18090 [Rufibacter radiotolerans]|uniref:TonB-dependent receptor plug domain-containing protein n=1 Tax=Rufibacter radiotolerans TaxID=1379910 RepID=A0A0H4VTJ0_9BACT|nr:TonB-dependent receptor plug domain-containing protein [Rufibacter radiotolerans]AKQ47119.1 hypothetical protein TH63_18090 [Rufibacter radiotolerans]
MPFQRKKTFLFLSLAAVLAVSSFAPNEWQEGGMLQKIAAKLSTYTRNYPQEKVYLHLDKPFYAAGEDIWFKAYVVEAEQHAPSPLSKVLYVELINQEDSVYSRVAIDVQDGVGKGDFALSDTISQGLYRVRAYTSWMQNSDEEYFFHQNVNIYNPRVEDVVPTVAFDLQRQGAGDSVRVRLSLKNHREEVIPQTPFTYHTRLNRKQSSKKKGMTNLGGNAEFRFFLPDGAARENARLELTILEGKQQYHRSFQVPQAVDKPDVQFFPESGDLVANMWSTVGLKVVDVNGLGKEAQGSVFDQDGQKVADFKTLKFGMGRFGFKPLPGKKYQARLKNAQGAELTYALPAVKERGLTMTVDPLKEGNIRVKGFLTGYADGVGRPKSIYVIGQTRGKVYFTGQASMTKDVFVMEVPFSTLPTGVCQITMFSDTGQPLAERLVFVDRAMNLQLTLTSEKPIYKPREKVTMHLKALDYTGKPVAGNFSVAVTDAQKVEQESDGATILTNLLLTSDLRGHIEQPGYYFSSQHPEAGLALDNLMLTQGWRRFLWKDILEEKKPALPYPLEQAVAVTGKVLKLSGKPEPNAGVTLYDLRNLGNMQTTTTDANGKFLFGIKDISDSSRLVVQARSPKGKSSLEVVLEKGLPVTLVKPQVPYAPAPAPYSPALWEYLQGNREQLKLDQLAGKSILLNAVNIKGQKDKEEEDWSSSGLHNQADRSFKGSDLPMSLDLITNLQGRVAGLQVRGNEVSMRGGGEPLFLVDGMPIDIDYVRSISMNEIERVDILKPGPNAAIYGLQGGNGVIAVTLKKGVSVANPETRWKGIAAYQGVRLQQARAFYMPRYDKPSNIEAPDLRTTIFWSPTVTTDANGRGSFSFFAADAKTTYRAILEGFTGKGQLGRAEASLQVKSAF